MNNRKIIASFILSFYVGAHFLVGPVSWAKIINEVVANRATMQTKSTGIVAQASAQEINEDKETTTETEVELKDGSAKVIERPPTARMGVHILSIDELESAYKMIQSDERAGAWVYLTIPLTLKDLEKEEEWQLFFDKAKEYRLIPIVRLATEFKDESWQIPDRKQIIDQITFLKKLDWPTDEKHIIIYNEVNHSYEWGGKIDPKGYARTLTFAAKWASTDNSNFVVLPAALDLATPSNKISMEAFTYWKEALAEEPELFSVIDAWNSHSYPNPAFSAPPTAKGKNSLKGFEYELDFIASHTTEELPVFITETGWRNSLLLQRKLGSYYEYAVSKVWSHPQVKAVTPFVLSGSPGPFAEFTFLDSAGKPTAQYAAFRNALKLDTITISN